MLDSTTWKDFFFYFGKTWNGKNYPFANVTFCCRSIKVRQWFFQAVVSSKKWTNKFNITTCRLFFIRFWKKVNTPKRHFEIKWPLAEIFFGNFWLCLPTGVQIAKKNPSRWKNSHLQVDCFCQFIFWHNIENHFWILECTAYSCVLRVLFFAYSRLSNIRTVPKQPILKLKMLVRLKRFIR